MIRIGLATSALLAEWTRPSLMVGAVNSASPNKTRTNPDAWAGKPPKRDQP
jgi:hypothetical protein